MSVCGHRNAGLRSLATGVALAGLATQLGCGISGGQQVQQVHLQGAGDMIRNRAKTATVDATLRMNTLQVIDTWGLLVSLIASNANAVAGRDQAIRNAIENGAVDGDEVEYGYAFVPPRPGVISTIRLSWGDTSDAEHTRPAGGEQIDPIHKSGDLSAFDFDFTTGLRLWGFEDCCNVGLTLSAVYQSWEAETLDVKATRIAMPLGLSVGRDLFARTHLALVAKYDVTSALTMWLYDHWLDYSVGAQLNVVLLSWLQLQFDASRAQVALNDGDGWGTVWQAGGTLTVMFGNGEDEDSDGGDDD